MCGNTKYLIGFFTKSSVESSTFPTSQAIRLSQPRCLSQRQVSKTQGIGVNPNQVSQVPRGRAQHPALPVSEDQDESEISVLAAVSMQERVNDRDFSQLTPEELVLIRRLVDELPLVPPRKTRHRSRKARKGNRIDFRATLRASHRTGGEPIRMINRMNTTKPRRVVLIADISGSHGTVRSRLFTFNARCGAGVRC